MRRFAQRLRQFDWLLFGCLIIVISIGLVLLYSVASGREGGNLDIFWRQLVIAGGGIVVLFVLSSIDFRTWEGVSWIMYAVMASLLILVLIFGQTVNATRGWIEAVGFRFQPVEFAKVVAIIALAAYFARRSRELDRLQNLLQSLAIIGFFIVLVLLQPDFGSAAIIFSLWVGMVFIIGVRREYLIGFLVATLIAGAVGWLFLFKPYQKDRLTTFFFPSDRAQTQSYNVKQAIIAVGSGELTGRGLGQGSQSQLRFLPEASTDFIFATLSEELGLAGVGVLFTLLAIIYYRLFRLLSICRDGFGSFLILGTILLISVEIFVNAGMNVGIFPVVGIPFPFLSSGGSSLLAHLILFGLIESIARSEGSRGYQLSSASAM